MPTPLPTRRAIVGTLMLLLTACAAEGSPSVSPAESASVETSAEQDLAVGRVTSERFGWSMELTPPEWAYEPATEDWPAETYPAPGARYTDNFARPAENFPVIDVSTQVLPEGQSEEDFLAFMDAGTATIGCDVETTEEVTVDGAPARLQRQVCASGNEVAWEAIAFDDGRVYVIYWIALTDEAEADEPVFRELLETFRFAP